jgi:hypothetical protein
MLGGDQPTDFDCRGSMVRHGALVKVCRLCQSPHTDPAIAAIAIHEGHMRAKNQPRCRG